MQFIAAKRKLKRLAKGKYHCLSYELTEYSGRPITQHTQCRIYIDGEDGFYGATFKEAFKHRVEALTPEVTEEIPKPLPPDIPDGESSR